MPFVKAFDDEPGKLLSFPDTEYVEFIGKSVFQDQVDHGWLEAFRTRGGNLVVLSGDPAAPDGTAERWKKYSDLRALADDEVVSSLNTEERDRMFF